MEIWGLVGFLNRDKYASLLGWEGGLCVFGIQEKG